MCGEHQIPEYVSSLSLRECAGILQARPVKLSSLAARSEVCRVSRDMCSPRSRVAEKLEANSGCFPGRSGSDHHRDKGTLTLDRESYLYRKFPSDIPGRNIKSHEVQPLP